MSDNAPAHSVPFAAYTPMRCSQLLFLQPRVICGRVASWRRPGVHWFEDRYFCPLHHVSRDEPIVGELVCRRVSIEAVIRLTATDLRLGLGNAEALARMEDLVESAGGLLDVQRVTSSIGRMPAPPAPQDAIDGSPGPQGHPVRH